MENGLRRLLPSFPFSRPYPELTLYIMKKVQKGFQARKVDFKIKIINCLSQLDWYHDRVGKVYNITLEGTYHYYFRTKMGGLRAIQKVDCKKLS